MLLGFTKVEIQYKKREDIVMKYFFLFLVIFNCQSKKISSEELFLIDAHSQVPSLNDSKKVISILDKAGVRKIILSNRREFHYEKLLKLSDSYPNRIFPAIKLKGNLWRSEKDDFRVKIKHQIKSNRYIAFGEVLLYHASKGIDGGKAPEYNISTQSKNFRFILENARKKGWPVPIHVEFNKVEDFKERMEELEYILYHNRDISFPLMHMGQLGIDQVLRLIKENENIYFMLSRSHTIQINTTNQPWTNLFNGDKIKPEWRDLLIQFPHRFIFAVDAVWSKDWSQSYYINIVQLWRKTLNEFPKYVSNLIAFQNAERLWRLKINQSGIDKLFTNYE